jgi:DNA processing protein
VELEQLVDDTAALLALAEVCAGQLANASTIRLANVVLALVSEPEALDGDEHEWITTQAARVRDDRIQHWQSEVERLETRGIFVSSITDSSYPANLRMIHNHPPFLFVRGEILRSDARSIAIVGSRDSDAPSVRQAYELAVGLASEGIVIVSGLAEGIDTAAHSGALDAGGRTVAVFGTGIERCFPAKNRELASLISESGACVSQFWPSTSGAKWTFPTRNIVTSGLSLATLVVEAGENSGARRQAEEAMRHGKRLFLTEEVLARDWARSIAESPSVSIVDSVEGVVKEIDDDLDTSADLMV